MLFFKNVIFTLLVPGTVTGLVPFLILAGDPRKFIPTAEPFRWAGLLPMAAGAAVLLRSIWDFAVIGRGTPAPIDPPKALVVQGFYRYVRNPMYCAVMLLLVGETILFQSSALGRYTIGTFITIHLFVIFYEEPNLRKRFGFSYEAYCRSVRRWVPRQRG